MKYPFVYFRNGRQYLAVLDNLTADLISVELHNGQKGLFVKAEKNEWIVRNLNADSDLLGSLYQAFLKRKGENY